MNNLAGPPQNPSPTDLSQRALSGVVEAAQVRERLRREAAGAARYSTLLNPAAGGVGHGAVLR